MPSRQIALSVLSAVCCHEPSAASSGTCRGQKLETQKAFLYLRRSAETVAGGVVPAAASSRVKTLRKPFCSASVATPFAEPGTTGKQRQTKPRWASASRT